MPRWAQQTLSGWGRVLHAEGPVARPERSGELAGLFDDPVTRTRTLLARGAGRSYGDAALNSGGATVLTQRLDRLLTFDATTGDLVAEAGVTFGEMLRVFLPRGFMPPVVPGTGLATLGGGVANDVHGKNHHRSGSLGQHLRWVDLRLPSGELRQVAPDRDAELFRATVGGLGLTGIIERVALTLTRVPANAVSVRKQRIQDLDHFVEALAAAQDGDPYVVGWIDALAGGRHLGRGILETASPAANNIDHQPRKTRRLPLDAPNGLLGPLTVRLFNRAYRARVPANGCTLHLPFEQFLFPLDAIHDWNRMYGRRGFHQFQCVVPYDGGARALRKMLELISASGHGSFLAVLKTMGPPGVGFMSFPMPGYTLALDFPNAPGATALIGQLERVTLDHGGRTYLAKDSTLQPAMLRPMYPQLERFEQVLASIDPARRMGSDLSRRLGIGARRP